MGLFDKSGFIRVTKAPDSGFVGVYAPDGSYYVTKAPNTGYVGRYAPNGSYYVTDATNSLSPGSLDNNGSLYVTTINENNGAVKVSYGYILLETGVDGISMENAPGIMKKEG